MPAFTRYIQQTKTRMTETTRHESSSAYPAPAMRAAMRSISVLSFSAMKGSAISSDRKMARIFGTKAMVISWICVSACSSEIATPTARPTSMTGADTTISVKIASRATSRTSDPVMELDRHLHDVVIGRDHLVAHRHDRIDRDLGLGHRGDHVHHVSPAGDEIARLRVGLVTHVGDGADRLLEQGGETRGVGRRRAGRRRNGAGGVRGQSRGGGIGIGGDERSSHGVSLQALRMSIVRWIM